MCKKFFSALDVNTTTLFAPQEENNDDDSFRSDSEVDSDDDLIKPHSLCDGDLDVMGCDKGNCNPFFENDQAVLDNFFTTCLDAHVPIIEDNNIGLFQRFQVDDVPTTNAGDAVLNIEEETAHGGSFGNAKMSIHVLLNQF